MKSIEQAAIDFVQSRQAKLTAKALRKKLMSVEGGFCENWHGERNSDQLEHCYQAFIDGKIKWSEFCKSCQDVHQACCDVKSLSAKTSRKLRVLINAVARETK